MLIAGAAVGEGRLAQGGLAEGMTKPALNPTQKLVRIDLMIHCTFTVFSKCTDNDTLAMYGTESS